MKMVTIPRILRIIGKTVGRVGGGGGGGGRGVEYNNYSGWWVED